MKYKSGRFSKTQTVGALGHMTGPPQSPDAEPDEMSCTFSPHEANCENANSQVPSRSY